MCSILVCSLLYFYLFIFSLLFSESQMRYFCRFFLFVCFSFHSRIFQSYADVIIAGEGLQNWTYARHLLPLNSERSLACHIGASVYNGHLRGPETLIPIAERLVVELSLPVFTCVAEGESRSRSAVTPSVCPSVRPKILSSQLL